MNLRRRYWSWIGTALCLNGMVVLAQDEPVRVPLAEPQDVLINVNVEQNDAVKEVEIVQEAGPKVGVRQVIVGGAGGAARTIAVTSDGGVSGILTVDADQGKYWIGLLCNPAGDA